MKFSLATIAYVFALLAAGMAAFGPSWGAVAAVAVLAHWVWAYSDPKSELRTVGFVTAVFLIASLLMALLAPAIQGARERAQHAQCQNNIRQLALALISRSLSARGAPPPTLAKNGVAMHSWRTMILPVLDERTLFEKYDLQEVWNGPNNGPAVTSSPIAVFQCPSHVSGIAGGCSYFAVVDPRTAWSDEGPLLRLGKIRDGASRTILLMEGPEQPWGKPVDLTFEEAVNLLCDPAPKDIVGHIIDNGYFYKPSRVLHVAMCDGSTRELQVPLRRSLAEALLTANGREEIDERELAAVSEPELDYETCYAFGAFVALAALPGVRLLWKSKRNEGSPAAR